MKGEIFRFPVTFTPQDILPQTIKLRISKYLTFLYITCTSCVSQGYVM